jgi:hypothetical protein
MTITAISKRIDNLETRLTPKEWAIRIADEIRKYPSQHEYLRYLTEHSNINETLWVKPFAMLKQLSEELYPGKKPFEMQTQRDHTRKLQMEFLVLKSLIHEINTRARQNVEIMKPQFLLQMALLRIHIMGDIASTHFIKESRKKTDKWQENGNPPESLEYWQLKTTGWIDEFFTGNELFKTVSELYLDGHPFIFLDIENQLTGIKKIIDEIVSLFNDYIKAVAERFKAENLQEISGKMSFYFFNIEEIKKEVEQGPIISIAKKWMEHVKTGATINVLEMLDRQDEANTLVWNMMKNSIKPRHENNQIN